MCGIIAIVSRPPQRPAPEPASLLEGLDRALALVGDPAAVAEAAAEVDAALRGLPGVLALADRHELVASIEVRLDQLDAYSEAVEAALADESPASTPMPWNERTVLRYASATCCGRSVATASAPRARSTPSLDATRRCQLAAGYLAIQQALSAIDRMEVRGRDSAGLHVFVWDRRLDLDHPAGPRVRDELRDRSGDRLFQARSRAVRRWTGRVGALLRLQGGGRDRRARRQHGGDAVADRRRRSTSAGAVVPVGRGVGARPHALGERRDHLRAQRPPRQQRRARAGRPGSGRCPEDRTAGPYVVGVLNGDVDNHADLKAAHGLRIAGQITTDAKVIPALVVTQRAGHRRRPRWHRRGLPPRRRQLRRVGRHRRGDAVHALS